MTSAIQNEIAAIYEASGFKVQPNVTPGLLVATRPKEGGGTEQVNICLPQEIEPKLSADEVIARIAGFRPEEPDRKFVVALKTSTSFGAPFQSRVKDAGGELRSYAFIQDGGWGGDYIGLGASGSDHTKWRERHDKIFDYSRVDADLLSAVVRKNLEERALAEAPSRVHQRYFLRSGIAPETRSPRAGDDLLRFLVAKLGQPSTAPEVFLIIGPGGSGKSWLFEGLYTYQYEAFQRIKQQQASGIRPIPIMPDDLIALGARTTGRLLAEAGRTAYGSAAKPELLDLLVRNGRATLMFDGLDEFLGESADFGREITERYLGEDSKARIFIVLRDSLLETSPQVRDMVLRFTKAVGPEHLTIMEIAPWEHEHGQRELAWIKLEKRRPRAGEPDTPRVAGFLSWLNRSPRIEELARLAFYCDLLADLYASLEPGKSMIEHLGRPTPEDEYDLLEICFDLIVDRELDKQRPEIGVEPEKAFLAPEHRAIAEDDIQRLLALGTGSSALDVQFATDSAFGDPYAAWGRLGLIGLIEEAAYFARRNPSAAAAGLTAEGLRGLYRNQELGADDSDRQLGERMLRQFVLFVQGNRPGTIDFAHEFMADFLAARHVVNLLKAGKGTLEDLAGTPVNGETEVFRGYLVRELGEQGWGSDTRSRQ